MDMLQRTTLEGKLKVGVEEAVQALKWIATGALSGLLSDIQDCYTFSQPEIQRRVQYLRDPVSMFDRPL